MKIGILSDTHDQLERTIRAVELLRFRGVEHLIHCGDYTGTDIIHACGVLPSTLVLGNNDYEQASLRAAAEAVGATFLGLGGIVRLNGKTIAVTHGHHTSTFRSLIASNPDYLLFGHVHFPLNERDGSTRQINPGALHRAEQYTVAELDLERDRVTFHEVE